MNEAKPKHFTLTEHQNQHLGSPNGSTVFPLLKTMNVRDTSKYEFEVIKYN